MNEESCNSPIKPEVCEKEVDVGRSIQLAYKGIRVVKKYNGIMIIHQVHVDTMFLHQMKCLRKLQTTKQDKNTNVMRTTTGHYFSMLPSQYLYIIVENVIQDNRT